MWRDVEWFCNVCDVWDVVVEVLCLLDSVAECDVDWWRFMWFFECVLVEFCVGFFDFVDKWREYDRRVCDDCDDEDDDESVDGEGVCFFLVFVWFVGDVEGEGFFFLFGDVMFGVEVLKVVLCEVLGGICFGLSMLVIVIILIFWLLLIIFGFIEDIVFVFMYIFVRVFILVAFWYFFLDMWRIFF